MRFRASRRPTGETVQTPRRLDGAFAEHPLLRKWPRRDQRGVDAVPQGISGKDIGHTDTFMPQHPADMTYRWLRTAAPQTTLRCSVEDRKSPYRAEGSSRDAVRPVQPVPSPVTAGTRRLRCARSKTPPRRQDAHRALWAQPGLGVRRAGGPGDPRAAAGVHEKNGPDNGGDCSSLSG